MADELFVDTFGDTIAALAARATAPPSATSSPAPGARTLPVPGEIVTDRASMRPAVVVMVGQTRVSEGRGRFRLVPQLTIEFEDGTDITVDPSAVELVNFNEQLEIARAHNFPSPPLVQR